ncbi:glycosyltransferase family 62 protein, partial [Wickerhamomyces anomalus NRRL Y-366-8]
MSRQRNIASSGGEGKPELSSSDEELQIDVKEKYNHHSQDSIFTSLNLDESSIIDGAFELFKLLIQTIYSVLPFFIIFYLYSIYQTNEEHFYAPDFPNSLHSSSIDSLNDIGVEFYDLADFKSTGNGWQNNERVLFLVPLRDASAHLPMFFSHMKNLTYPHNLIDLAFLISDTSDSTIPDLKSHLKTIQADSDKSKRFGRIDIYEKNFGQIVGQSFSDRHGFAAQGPRRKLMAIARNWLLTTALRPDHSWVYWRDADVETVPATIIEDLMHHDKDVIVPNIWRPLPDWLGSEQAYDLNSWQESEGGVELAEQLDEDAVIVEGYPEYATWRPHLAYLRDPYGDEEVEIELDGIGGVSILAKANVFRQGAMFPAFSFKKHAETEAFGKLCKTMGFNVIGLPHYVIWHIYEPSTDDLKHMEWLANEELRQREYEKNKVVYDKAWKLAFEDVSDQWREEKFNVFKNTDLSRLKIGSVDWDEVDEYLAEVDEFEDLR